LIALFNARSKAASAVELLLGASSAEFVGSFSGGGLWNTRNWRPFCVDMATLFPTPKTALRREQRSPYFRRAQSLAKLPRLAYAELARSAFMNDKSFATRVASLRNKYHELLAEDGLDKIPISEEKARESFEAMFDAGWYPDKTLTKEEAWAVVWAEKSKRFAAHGYDNLMNRLALEVEEDIRLRGGVLPCPVYVGTWPIGYTNACAMPTADGVLVLLSHGLIM
jgi:hypothetical protein